MKRTKSETQARVKATVFAAFPEGLLNSAVAKGIELWQIEKINDNTVSFEMYESRLTELEELARSCGAELTVHKYRDKSRRLIKKRLILLPLSGIAAALVLVSSLFVWQIEIHGNRKLSRGEILRALEDSGLYYGCFWPGLNADDIRSRMLPELQELAWMTVNVSGSRAVVLVNERVEKPEIYNESAAADLVASKTGLIRRVSVLQGKAAVSPGQAVTAGETLASGSLDSIMGTVRTVRSKGSVMADTWYEIDAVCPEEMQLKTDFGLSRHRFAIVLGKRRINFYISSGKAIDECDKIIDEYTLGLDGFFALPIRIVHERIVPYISSPGQGHDTETMGRRLSAILDAGTEGQILQSSFTESRHDGLYMLTLRAHCVENIALTREID